MGSFNIGPGWNISEQGYTSISQCNTLTEKNTLVKNALNADLREIGSPALSKELNKNQISELVLQIQKIRNVAAPKANEESNAAPRMLKLTLTDGETFVQAIEISNIPFISRDKTPPGSKVLLKNVKSQNGFLCLNQNNTKLLGGNVPHLLDKWELAKTVQHHSRTVVSADGPPAWVNFGIKVSNFEEESKSSDSVKAKEQVKENVEFENLRKDAIAEAATGAVRKVFGAGAKLVNAAPRIDTNKVRNDRSKQSSKNNKDMKTSKESIPQKPSDKVSLFDFLENKLQIAGASSDVKISQDDGNRKIQFNDQNHSNQKIMTQKKDYCKNYQNEYCFNSEYDNLRNSGFQKQSSFHGHTEYNKPQFRNYDQINSSKGYGTKFTKDDDKKFTKEYDNMKVAKENNVTKKEYISSRVTKEFESSNSYGRYNPRDSPCKKSSTARYPNDSVKNLHDVERQNNKKNNTEHISQQRNNQQINNQQICRRNEEEKMHDNWHYRAPNLSYQGQTKPSNNEDNLTEHVAKMSISGEFASRSLRQHLNLSGKKPNSPRNSFETNKIDNSVSFNVGDECLAKYWEDNKFYPSKITASTETTYVVQFKGYGNIEEVLKIDCIPLDQDRGEKRRNNKGTLEFRRNTKKVLSS